MNECDINTACFGRREFLVKAGFLAGATVLTVSGLAGGASAGAVEDVKIAVGPDSPLAKVGGSQVVDSSAGKIIVIHVSDAKYVALSAMCTHKRGLLSFDAAKNQLSCPKHGSKFDAASGKVQSGPADEPLTSYAAKAADGSVSVTVGS